MARFAKSIFIFLVLTAFASTAVAASWQDQARKHFEADEYEKVIDIAKKQKKDKLGLMFLTFAHLQRYAYNDTKLDKRKYKDYLDMLEDSVTVNDLDNIHYFIKQDDKPDVVKTARKLLKAAFKNISDISDIPKVIKFLDNEDQKTRKLALDTIKRLISVKRKYVNKGGTLRDKDILIMQDEKLIRALLNHVSDAKARNILVMIEQPVLAYLGDYDDAAITKLEIKINKAIAKREKKHPDSTWYSASGKEKAVAK